MVVSNYNKTKEKNKMTEEMKFCSKCGKKILKEAEMCPHCGIRQVSTTISNGKISIGWLIFWLIFCFPIAIIYVLIKILEK